MPESAVARSPRGPLGWARCRVAEGESEMKAKAVGTPVIGVALVLAALVALLPPAHAGAAVRPKRGHTAVVKALRGVVLVTPRGSGRTVRLHGQRTIRLG